MSTALTSPSAPHSTVRLGLASVLAGMSFLGVLLVWWGLVLSYHGQMAEQTALAGSLIGARFVTEHARNLLHIITMPTLVLLVLSILVLALWRGSRRRALWAAGTVVATNVSAQVLKYWVLWRPDYGFSERWDGGNTLPSGHTAVAASAAVALVLVIPARWRSLSAWAGALVAAATGYSTLACQWHRPGDVIAALLLAVGWGALAIALGAWSDEEPRPAEAARLRQMERLGSTGPIGHVWDDARRVDQFQKVERSRTPTVLLLAMGMLAALVAAPLELWTWHGAPYEADRMDLLAAYAAGSVGTVAVSCVGVSLIALLSTPPRTVPPSATPPRSVGSATEIGSIYH